MVPLPALGRWFSVAVNGLVVIRDYNIQLATGGNFIADIVEVDVMANAQGLVISFIDPRNADPLICGIEMMWMGGAMPPDAPPSTTLGGGGNSEWGPAVRPGAGGFIFVDW